MVNKKEAKRLSRVKRSCRKKDRGQSDIKYAGCTVEEWMRIYAEQGQKSDVAHEQMIDVLTQRRVRDLNDRPMRKESEYGEE